MRDCVFHEYEFLNAPEQAQIQSDLFYDYRTNVDAYTTWQAWMRRAQPRLLVIWGKHDLSFDLGESERYRADVPNAKVLVLHAGHFALDTKAEEITDRRTPNGEGFNHATQLAISAAGAGKLFGLSAGEIANAIAIATVDNISLVCFTPSQFRSGRVFRPERLVCAPSTLPLWPRLVS